MKILKYVNARTKFLTISLRFSMCFLVTLLLPIAGLFAENKLDKPPTGIFNALFLGDEKLRTFVYAPWGNRGDENATIEKIRIGSGAFYSKFAYYGKSPLQLEELVETNEEKSNVEGNSIPLKVRHTFNSTPGTKEEILMIRLEDEGVKQVYPIDFSQSEIPLGSILFQSYAKEAVYISLAKEKFKLSNGESRLFKLDTSAPHQHMLILGYLNRNGGYKKAFKQMIRNLNTQRGIIMLRIEGSLIKSMNLLESSNKHGNIIGLNSKPWTTPRPNILDANKSPELDQSAGFKQGVNF